MATLLRFKQMFKQIHINCLSLLSYCFFPPFRIFGNHPFLTRSSCSKSSLMVQSEEKPTMPQRALQKRLAMKSAATGASYAKEQEHPPRAGAEIIMRLDDDGVEDADDHKSGHAEQESFCSS